MVPALAAEVILDDRGTLDGLFAGDNLAVQYPQGVRGHPPGAVGAELLDALAQKSLERILELLPAGPAPQGIHLHDKSAQAQRARQLVGHLESLRVAERAALAETLGVDLVKLAVPPLLRPLVAEHGPDAEDLLDGIHRQEPVLDDRPEHGGRGLGPQAHRGAGLVGKGVHLLLHHIGVIADAAKEQLRALQDRGPELLEPVQAKDLPCCLFHEPPPGRLAREDVVHSSYRFHFHHMPPNYFIGISLCPCLSIGLRPGAYRAWSPAFTRKGSCLGLRSRFLCSVSR